jgi:hypothetical protein
LVFPTNENPLDLGRKILSWIGRKAIGATATIVVIVMLGTTLFAREGNWFPLIITQVDA